MSWALAIDFGTAVTAAATIELGGSTPVRPVAVEVGGSWRVPSSVLRLDSGQLVVGAMAERQAAMRIEAYEPTPKRRLGEGTIDLGGPVLVTDAVAALLRVMVAEAVRSRGGTAPEAVCLTHPASWARTRQAALRQAAEIAGLRNVLLLPEPVAAACWYAATSGRVPSGGRVAVYDLGGGTFDAAIVESKGDGTFGTVGRPSGIDPLGGVDFDYVLLDLVGETIARRDQPLWESLEQPQDTAARRRRRALLGQVRALKEDLSTVTQSTLLVPETSMEVTVTRDEFAAAISPHIQRSATVLEHTIAAAGMSAGQLAAVYLVGGSSRIPMVEEVIAQRLAITPATLDEPKQVVAFGAVTHLAALARPMALSAQPSAPHPPTPLPPTATSGPFPTPQPLPMPMPQPPASQPPRSRTGLIVAAVLAAVLVIGAVILTVALINTNGGQDNSGQTEAAGTTTSTSQSGGSGPVSSQPGSSDPPPGNGTDPRLYIEQHVQAWADLDQCTEGSPPAGADLSLDCSATQDGVAFTFGWYNFRTPADLDSYIADLSAGGPGFTTVQADIWYEPESGVRLGDYVLLQNADGSGTIVWGFDDNSVAGYIVMPGGSSAAYDFWAQPGNSGVH